MAILEVTLPREQLVELADLVAERLTQPRSDDGWLDSKAAADYLSVHVVTLRKAAARGELPYEQERPGTKLYFRRSDLDGWRAGRSSG